MAAKRARVWLVQMVLHDSSVESFVVKVWASTEREAGRVATGKTTSGFTAGMTAPLVGKNDKYFERRNYLKACGPMWSPPQRYSAASI
jgi:hypothetical protein